MSLARVQFFSISLDGFGTGEGQSHDAIRGRDRTNVAARQIKDRSCVLQTANR